MTGLRKRVTVGFLLAAVIAVPLGIMMGSLKVCEALAEPMLSFIRYMPASAFIPLFILWLGIGETEKIAVIFFGTFFPQRDHVDALHPPPARK